MAAQDGGLFGRIARKKGYVSERGLQQALRLQEECRAFGVAKPLGELLVATGALSPEQVERILRLQRRNENKRLTKRFAQVALLNGFVSEDDLDRAMREARESGYRRSLRDLLVEQGALEKKTARAIQRALQQARAQQDEQREARTRFFPAEGLEIDVGEAGDEEEEPGRTVEQRSDLLFAAVALRDGLVLVSELERALEEQSYRHDGPRLVEVLQERGVLNEDQVGTIERSLAASRRDHVQIPGYEVTDLLGHGSTSIVLRARHELIDREVAIKVFREEHMASAKLDELMAEARTIGRIRHPNVVGLHEVGLVQRRIFYVMELFDGPTLMERIREESQLDRRAVLLCGRDVAAALQAVQEAGLVHRDVKPHNILLTDGGAKLTDLGLAREAGSLVTSGMIYGTPYTISPEQAQGEHVDIRSDLYGLGASLYYALTGEPPYEAETPLAILLKHINEPVPDPRALRPKLQRRTAKLVMRLMAKRPEDRVPTPAALVEELEALLG